jgi:long-chain fatty acid transport protein
LGIRIPDQDAAATARGDAFAATADDPAAIYYNPAGITAFDGTRVLLNGYGIFLNSRVSLSDNRGNFSNGDKGLQAVPDFYLTWKAPNVPVALGFGIYAPFGFALDYNDNVPFRTIYRKGSIQYLTFNPVGAIQVTRTLSIALGATVNYGDAELARGVVAPGDEFDFKGHGTAYGFNAGIMWDPTPMNHFGATYRSTERIDFVGHSKTFYDSFDVLTPYGPFPVPGASYRQNADAEFNMPQSVTLGYSFRPTPDWNFEFDWDWTDWNTLNNVTLKQSRTGNISLPFDWQASSMYEFGITKKFAHHFHASVGYVYSQKSVPNETFSPGIPDSNRHIFSAGVGQKFDHVSWNLAYQFTYGPPRTISQGSAADGVYRFDANAITLSIGYDF